MYDVTLGTMHKDYAVYRSETETPTFCNKLQEFKVLIPALFVCQFVERMIVYFELRNLHAFYARACSTLVFGACVLACVDTTHTRQKKATFIIRPSCTIFFLLSSPA